MSKRRSDAQEKSARSTDPTIKVKKSGGLSSNMQWGILGGSLLFILGAWLWFFQLSPNANTVSVTMPKLSRNAQAGQTAFTANCASCHGQKAGGSQSGPPLIHKYYEPNHHGDGAFFLAVKTGVRQHHWGFGDMPPRPEVTQRQVQSIVAFIREVQAANGIF